MYFITTLKKYSTKTYFTIITLLYDAFLVDTLTR